MQLSSSATDLLKAIPRRSFSLPLCRFIRSVLKYSGSNAPRKLSINYGVDSFDSDVAARQLFEKKFVRRMIKAISLND